LSPFRNLEVTLTYFPRKNLTSILGGIFSREITHGKIFSRHFKTPHEFNPEHFSEEAKKKLHPMAFLGFGQGPRTCIGKPLALMSMKMTLAKVGPDLTFLALNGLIHQCVS
jgi:hypothetical protein